MRVGDLGACSMHCWVHEWEGWVMSSIGGRLFFQCFSKVHYCMSVLFCSPIDAVFENDYWFQITERGSRSSFRPLIGWGLHRFVWKSQRLKLTAKPIEWYSLNPSLFSLVNTFKPPYFPGYFLRVCRVQTLVKILYLNLLKYRESMIPSSTSQLKLPKELYLLYIYSTVHSDNGRGAKLNIKISLIL
jgi:hypothetical protein